MSGMSFKDKDEEEREFLKAPGKAYDDALMARYKAEDEAAALRVKLNETLARANHAETEQWAMVWNLVNTLGIKDSGCPDSQIKYYVQKLRAELTAAMGLLAACNRKGDGTIFCGKCGADLGSDGIVDALAEQTARADALLALVVEWAKEAEQIDRLGWGNYEQTEIIEGLTTSIRAEAAKAVRP